MKTPLKYILILIILLLTFLPAENSYAQNPLDNPAKQDVSGVCFAFPGFINKIVQCIVYLTSYGLIDTALEKMHSAFVSVANSMVIIYVMLFGMRMSLRQIKDLKKEAAIVLLTAFCIIYFNNTTSITKFMNFFIKGQAEFVNATTSAITTKRIGTSQNANTALLCDSYNGKQFTVWQRIDCVIGYVLGVHPLVEFTENHFDCSKEYNQVDLLPTPLDPNKVTGCYDYRLFATGLEPWRNPASDPYNFPSAVATSNQKFETGVAFSMLTIITLMMFSDDFGLIVMITGVFIIIMLIMAFGQAVFVYITSLFTILVLGLFAPIVIPMFLFGPTKDIFNKWVQLFFSAMVTPGIMFAYLSFVIFTLQYVLDFKININGQPMSIMEYHFGEKYQNAQKEYKNVFHTVSENKDIYSQNSTEFIKTMRGVFERKAEASDINKNVNESAVRNPGLDRGSSSAELLEGFAGGNVFGAFGNIGIRSSGNAAGSLPLPDMDFSNTVQAVRDMYSIEGLGKVLLKLVNSTPPKLTPQAADDLMKMSTNANDIEEWMRIYQSSPALLEHLREAIQQHEREDYNDKLAYMQLLMIVFLTLSVTFTFMSNVQIFANNLANAGSLPASKMANLYNDSIRRMTAGINRKE